MFFGGIIDNNAVQLFKDLGAALPDATLWGPDGVAVSTFTNDLPADVAERTYITVATINPKDYGPKGQKFFEDFKAKYDQKVDPAVRHLRVRGDGRDPRRDGARR